MWSLNVSLPQLCLLHWTPSSWAGGWGDSVSCRHVGQCAGWQDEAVRWRQNRTPPDAQLQTCCSPRCRQPGSWSLVGWALSLGYNTEWGDFSLHFLPASPPATACTPAYGEKCNQRSGIRTKLTLMHRLTYHRTTHKKVMQPYSGFP